MKYIGDGSAIAGIPARDLIAAEWEALSQEQKEAVKNSGLYASEEKPRVYKENKQRGDE